MRCAVVVFLLVSIVTTARGAGAQPAEHIAHLDPAMLPRFDVASIKPSPADWKVASDEHPPGGFASQNGIAGNTLTLAFDVDRDRVVGAPGRVGTAPFEQEAMSEGDESARAGAN